MARGDVLTIPLPFSGSQTLTIGKERQGHIPVVIKAAAVHLARVSVGNGLGCFCPRAVAAKTCGGTVFEPDGVTPSPDCTPRFTAGDSVCAGAYPCAFLHGPGNSASGVIGCDGLDAVNVSLTQDSGGSSAITQPAHFTLSGTGAAGSSVLFGNTAIGGGICGCLGSGCRSRSVDQPTQCPSLCTGQDVSVYGPDGEFCTDDDPQSQRGSPVTAAVTTGTVTGQLLNANNQDGDNIGPFSATGAPFRCGGQQGMPGDASGVVLASTFTELNQFDLGDVVLTSVLVAGAAPCAGDCDGGGAVTINDLIRLVNIALGTAQLSACPHGVPGGGDVSIAMIIGAVNNALNGCGSGQ